ncbi:MAG: recombinase family protein [Anaerolineales bacterium]|nr:recombinase family protein [Anaerolineales bacterium]
MNKKISKKAVIYVRTSSEHQGEKSSPTEQEADCRQLALEHGLTVVQVYKDIERYRIKNKMVDPSGTRSDRPGLLAMLKDAEQGHFDVILAWREDRLYRGMRAMLMVLETIQEHKITVMLARETFDAKMAPLKAWVAQMELDGMKERMTMGVKARLRAGKANTGQDRYGYRRNKEVIEVLEDEAIWVRQIFEWYNDRIPLMEIRRRLIEADAPQKGSSIPRRIRWARSSIQAILKAAKDYAFGTKIQRRAGEAFTIPIEPIIDLLTYEMFLKVREANISHPSRNIKRDYLIAGLLYCACNRKWGARTQSQRRRSRSGEWTERKTRGGMYFCGQQHIEHVSPDCPRHIGSAKADNRVWEKVSQAISRPEILLAQANIMVDELRNSADSLVTEQDRIQNELDAITLERQWVITQARKGSISDEDMEYQLGVMTLQELNLKRELVSIGQAVNIHLLGDWEANVREYLYDLQIGLESLNVAPQNDEERQEIFTLKKQIVNTLVKRITIDRDRELHVEIGLNLLSLLEEKASNELATHGQNWQGGTYIHIRLIRARRHRCAFCG